MLFKIIGRTEWLNSEGVMAYQGRYCSLMQALFFLYVEKCQFGLYLE